jgi:hypothetical protein
VKDTEFMTAKEKEITLKQWETFVKHGFLPNHFKRRIYQHLTMHCSFIAHYSNQGFYDFYFREPTRILRFMEQFDRRVNGGRGIEIGGTHWLTNPEYNDINTAMCEVMEEHADRLREGIKADQRHNDLMVAKAILEKYGIEPNFTI